MYLLYILHERLSVNIRYFYCAVFIKKRSNLMKRRNAIRLIPLSIAGAAGMVGKVSSPKKGLQC